MCFSVAGRKAGCWAPTEALSLSTIADILELVLDTTCEGERLRAKDILCENTGFIKHVLKVAKLRISQVRNGARSRSGALNPPPEKRRGAISCFGENVFFLGGGCLKSGLSQIVVSGIHLRIP